MRPRISALELGDAGEHGQHHPSSRRRRISLLGWEHVNLTGDYVWAVLDETSDTRDGFRPLRPVREAVRLAA